jgi:hypothetical protein
LLNIVEVCRHKILQTRRLWNTIHARHRMTATVDLGNEMTPYNTRSSCDDDLHLQLAPNLVTAKANLRISCSKSLPMWRTGRRESESRQIYLRFLNEQHGAYQLKRVAIQRPTAGQKPNAYILFLPRDQPAARLRDKSIQDHTANPDRQYSGINTA